MSKPLTAVQKVNIAAAAHVIWDVLTKPEYIRQWDEVPDSYTGGDLNLGSVFEWKGEGGSTTLAVSVFDPPKSLAMRLYNTSWELEESEYSIAYRFEIARLPEGGSELAIEVGDFVELPDGEDYYDASVDFVEVASAKIKALAESVR